MPIREQIIKAIELYLSGDYDIKTFCDVFGSLYFYTSGGYKSFSEGERKYLDQVGFVTERFTTSDDDLEQYPNNFYSETQAKTIIDDILANYMC